MASSLVRRISTACYKSPSNHRFRLISSTKPPPPPPTPWLMLPPAFEGGDMLYKFYNLAKDQIIPIKKSRGGGGAAVPPDGAKLVGSSHGWLALFDENSNRVFLSNPISGRHVKLPAIDTLPDPDLNLLAGRGQVSRLVLSCSPEENECRVLITFGANDRLAFCAPRAAAEWTPIGDLYVEDKELDYIDRIAPEREENVRSYEDFVYSSKLGLFFCITEYYTDVEAWDLRDPLFPKLDWKLPFNEELRFAHHCHPWPVETKKECLFLHKCIHPKYVVVSDDGRLFIVVRHVAPRLRPDGSAAERIYFFGYGHRWDHRYPYKTVGFDVYNIDRKTGEVRHMEEGCLEGLAIFVGMNHSFAVSAAEFPQLKADSIYFTDEDRRITPKWVAPTSFGGHDNGVFDYREKSITSCCSSYYPVEYDKIRRIVPPPMWFTPTINNIS